MNGLPVLGTSEMYYCFTLQFCLQCIISANRAFYLILKLAVLYLLLILFKEYYQIYFSPSAIPVQILCRKR